MFKCSKCGCYKSITTIEIDKEKPRKKWKIYRCQHCDHPFDLEPYFDLIKRPRNYDDSNPTENPD